MKITAKNITRKQIIVYMVDVRGLSLDGFAGYTKSMIWTLLTPQEQAEAIKYTAN